jgi:hypothetical protein
MLQRPHHGARLASVTLTFQVGAVHSALPTVLPTVNIFRIGRDGSVTSMGPGNWQPTPSDGTAWYDGGATQSFTFAPATNNIIDCNNYAYAISLIDEAGSNSHTGNLYMSLTTVYDQIADMHFP